MSVRVTWVVVAEPPRATIYAITKGMARLREIETLEVAVDGDGSDPGAAFVVDIGRHLEDARCHGRFDALVLVASPGGLVSLRAGLSGPLRATLVGEIDRTRLADGDDTLQAEVLRIL